MTITISELLEKSFVLSVSPARYDTFCHRFSKYGLNKPLPRLYKGFKLKNGVYNKIGLIKTNNICNCNISHVCLIKVIQSLGWDYVCIFEDDALPCKNIIRDLTYYLTDIPDDTDMIKFGHLTQNTPCAASNNKFVRQKTLGSHAYLIFKKYYAQFAESFLVEQRIDRLCMNDTTKNIYSTNKLLFIQDDRNFNDSLHGNSTYIESNHSVDLTDFEL